MKCVATIGSLALVLVFGLGMGCENSTVTPPSASAPAERVAAGQPQPKLPTLKLWLGPHELTTELAITPEQKQRGMMYRTNMAEMEGMLFVFPGPHQAAFWMKNTTLPLSAAYIDPEGVIAEIRELKRLDENSVVAQSDNIQYVLETNHGWFERNGVGVGTVLRTERGSLRETFFRRQ